MMTLMEMNSYCASAVIGKQITLPDAQKKSFTGNKGVIIPDQVFPHVFTEEYRLVTETNR